MTGPNTTDGFLPNRMLYIKRLPSFPQKIASLSVLHSEFISVTEVQRAAWSEQFYWNWHSSNCYERNWPISSAWARLFCSKRTAVVLKPELYCGRSLQVTSVRRSFSSRHGSFQVVKAIAPFERAEYFAEALRQSGMQYQTSRVSNQRKSGTEDERVERELTSKRTALLTPNQTAAVTTSSSTTVCSTGSSDHLAVHGKRVGGQRRRDEFPAQIFFMEHMEIVILRRS